MTETIVERLAFPGLATRNGFFERAYATGSERWPTARVRFTSRQVDPGIADAVNVPVAPIAICVAVSVALVDDGGQVIAVAGRGLVADAAAHSWQVDAGDALDAEAWLLAIVRRDVPPVLEWAAMIAAAATSGLLAAVPAAAEPSPKVPE